ncbi:MAG: class I SAM-dependent methyltransferase [Nostoc sp. NMS9]|nr:class I SAM-dependent methyltransferase [Nostoc sp. NMS9]
MSAVQLQAFMDISGHYKQLFQTYGDSPQACQWSSRESQRQRLAYLLGVASVNGIQSTTKILDFGCGTGALPDFLLDKNIQAKYTGVDIVDEFLDCGRAKHPHQRFCKQFDIEPNETFDYIFISGIFNNNTGNNELFFETTLRWCWQHCNQAIAFNLLSTYVDYQELDLWYKAPEQTIQFIKSEFGHRTPFQMLNDYVLPRGAIPSEYTVYVYKQLTQ